LVLKNVTFNVEGTPNLCSVNAFSRRITKINPAAADDPTTIAPGAGPVVPDSSPPASAKSRFC